MTTRPAEAEPMMRGSWSCTDFWGSPGPHNAHRHKWLNNSRNTTWEIKEWPVLQVDILPIEAAIKTTKLENSLRKLEQQISRREVVRTVKAGAEVHGVAVASVSGNSASSDLHHVGRGGPQPLHLGWAVLGRYGVGHRLALKENRGPLKQQGQVFPDDFQLARWWGINLLVLS